jgi:hypothetical protein
LVSAEVFFFEDGLKIYAAKSGLFLEVVVASLVGNLVVVGVGGRDRGETEERFSGFSVICAGGGGKGEAQERKRCRRQKAQLSHGFLTKP